MKFLPVFSYKQLVRLLQSTSELLRLWIWTIIRFTNTTTLTTLHGRLLCLEQGELCSHQ